MGRVALVTGAASGIGAATVERFRERGWTAIGIDRQPGKGILVADVVDPEALKGAGARLEHEQLDALVCAAGIWDPADGGYDKVSLEAWERTWAVNVTGTMLTMRTFAPLLRAGGSVATIGSMAALVGMPRRDAYTASKGAVLALSRAWAADLIRRGIRVNCICPGITSTPMTAEALEGQSLRLPLDRPATPHEVAAVIVSACEPDAGYLNGAVIPVDGGMTAAVTTVDLRPRTTRN